MKVLIVANTFPPREQGGSGRAAAETARGFVELGHTVVVLTTMPYAGIKSLWPQMEKWEGCEVYRWYPLNIYHLSNAGRHNVLVRVLWTVVDIFNIASRCVVRRFLKKAQPNLIVSHNLKGMGFLLPRLFAKSAKYVHIAHDVQLAEPSGLLYEESAERVLGSVSRQVHIAIMRWLWATVKKVAAPSQFLLHFYTSLGFFAKADLMQLWNPIEAVQKVDHTGKRVVVVGIETHKGIDDVINVWARLGDVGAELHLIGGGERLAELMNKYADNPRVVVHGALDHKKFREVMGSADVLLHPSRCLENSPTAIAEALTLGVPVVATRVGGAPELVRMSVASMVVEVGDKEQMQNAVRNLLNNPPALQPIQFTEAKEYAGEIKKFSEA